MPAALGAVELVPMVLFVFLLAFLFAVKYTLHPLVATLHAALGWIPFAGDLVNRVDTAVLHAIDAGITGVEDAIVYLWHGVVWSFDETLLGLEYFTLQTVRAVEYLQGTAVPDFVHAVVDPTVAEVAHLRNWSLAQLGDAFAFVGALEVKIVKMGEATLANAISFVAAREAAIRTDAQAWAKTAEVDALDAVHAIGDAVAVDLPRYGGMALDDLEKLWGELDWTKIAEYGGAFALLYSLIHALEAEAGLGNSECRGKVKQICNTNPSQWAQLLEGLVALGFAFTLPELVKVAEPVVRELEPLIQQAA